MYVVSFIDAGKLVQVSTPSATVAATLAGYIPTCRVFKQNKLIRDITVLALIEECKRRYPHAMKRLERFATV
jgi:hypothetical protein